MFALVQSSACFIHSNYNIDMCIQYKGCEVEVNVVEVNGTKKHDLEKGKLEVPLKGPDFSDETERTKCIFFNSTSVK